MQLILALKTTLATLFPSTPEPTGADAVRRAVDELGDITQQTFSVELGEPTIEDGGGQFFSDPKIVVPIVSGPFGQSGSLVFDVPEGREDTESNLWAFLSAFDIEGIDYIDQLEGCTAPVRYAGGNPLVMWDQLLDPAKGSEDNPITKDDIEDSSDDAE